MRCLIQAMLLYLMAFGLPGGYTLDDPCTSAILLDSLKQRLVGYSIAVGETPLCDYYMNPGWYSMGSNVISSTNESCGTVYNWYMQGTLPTDDKTVEITACRNAGSSDVCSETKKINVKLCEKNKYVFELEPPDGCPEAYCIESLTPTDETGSPPDITSVKPEVTALFKRPDNITNISNFCCNFAPPAGTDFFYVVEWGISSGLSWTHTLKTFEPEKYIVQSHFCEKTALTEEILKNKNFGRLGITIACSVTAQSTLNGTSSAARESPPKFFGFEVLNTTVRVSYTEDTTIYLRLTAPFGCAYLENGSCTLSLNVYMPNERDTCHLPDLSQMQGIRNRCGIELRNDQINEWIPLRLTALVGVTRQNVKKAFNLILNTIAKVPSHPFFANYIIDPIKVEVHTDMTLLKNRLCYSHNDPHMLSFDGLRYENQNSGKFVLYRNKEYETQVQMQTTECRTNIWCNCGVVVNAGRDVFIVNNCGNGKSKNWDIRFRECKDGILRRKVKMVNMSNYKVYLPTGTVVTIKLHGNLLNVDIAPGLADYKKTEGLCGLFDKSTRNDRDKRPGSTETDPNLSWRVTPKEDLFDSRNDIKLTTWKDERLLCTCSTSSFETVNLVTCHPEVSKTCSDDRSTSILERQCSLMKRKKRNVHGIYVGKGNDLHQSVETNFVSKRTIAHNRYFPKQITKRKVYDRESAKADCMDVFNTTSFTICSSLPDIDFNDFIENCIQDAMITNSMDWSMTHLEAMKDKCIYEVKVNQRLPEEDLADVEIIVNNTAINQNRTTNESAAVPVMPSFSAKLLQDIEDVSCPNECSGNGKCEKGMCVCREKYIGDDCSVDGSLPPVMEGIPDRGECDLQFRECEQTSIFGTNFATTADLSCQLSPFVINSNYETITSDSVLTRKAELQTFVEVLCPLRQSRKKRSSESEQSDYVAYGYAISVSNDGVMYSEEDIIVIYDSECVNCTKENGNVVCRQNPGYCVKNGQCYRYGEIFGCKTCTGGTDNILHWEAGKDCPTPIMESEQPKKLWIIAATVCPVVLLVFIIVGIFCYQSKRVKTKRTDCVIDSFPSSRPDSTPK